MRKEDEKEIEYFGSKIHAYKLVYNDFDFKKNKDVEVKQIQCYIYRGWKNNQLLNLVECNDGSKFTSVNQAINQAKQYIEFFNKK